LEYSSEYLRFVSYGAVFQIAGTGLVPFIRNMGGAVTAMAAQAVRAGPPIFQQLLDKSDCPLPVVESANKQ
ncbi:hypothetical protein LEA_13153, partial [human gut metagenome]